MRVEEGLGFGTEREVGEQDVAIVLEKEGREGVVDA